MTMWLVLSKVPGGAEKQGSPQRHTRWVRLIRFGGQLPSAQAPGNPHLHY